MEKVMVVGIGHPYRGDDAVGLLVVRRLAACTTTPLDVRECTSDLTSLLDSWTAADGVVLVDAVTSGQPPGTVHVIDLLRDVPPPGRTVSDHAIGLAETVALGRAMGALPRALLLVGIEGEHFDIGQPPSPAVTAAIPAATAIARQEVLKLAAQLALTD